MSYGKDSSGRWYAKWYEAKKQKIKYFGKDDASELLAAEYDSRIKNAKNGKISLTLSHDKLKYHILYLDRKFTVADLLDTIFTDLELPLTFKTVRQIILDTVETKRVGIKAKLRHRILSRDNYTCQHCGAKAPEARLQVDHIKPISRGGLTEENNLLTLCQDCNSGKSDRISGCA